jgi:thiol-disulfide isomerase/thioredoxin
VLNFWATWCPPCIDEIPALNALQQKFPPDRVSVLAISIDTDAAAYQRFLKDYHILFTTARDPSSAIMHMYGTVKIPETYIINPEGYVARKIVSETDWTAPEMVQYLKDMSAGG